MNKRLIWRWVKIVLLLYGVGGIILYHTQDHFFWHPEAVPALAVREFGGQPHTEVNIPYDDKTKINVVEFRAIDRPADSPAKAVVLYFHGNRGDIDHYNGVAADFTKKGYEAWIWDYPGYGKSTGELSEQNLYDYAAVLYKLARSRWPASRIILYGRSIGTGIAAQLASVRECRRLILESPYYSLESLPYRYLPIYPWGRMLHYHLRTDLYLPKVKAPVVIFHGTADNTIPYDNGARLKPLLKAGDVFIPINGAGHNDLHEFPVFREKLDSILEKY